MSEMPSMSGVEMMGAMSMPSISKQRGMRGMRMRSALPVFPGSSHLYHVGSTGFFLTIEQQTSLSRIREKSCLSRRTSIRKIQQGE